MMMRARTESEGIKRETREAICESGEIIRLKFMAPFHARRCRPVRSAKEEIGAHKSPQSLKSSAFSRYETKSACICAVQK
jgi:phage portal protein BeeE